MTELLANPFQVRGRTSITGVGEGLELRLSVLVGPVLIGRHRGFEIGEGWRGHDQTEGAGERQGRQVHGQAFYA